MSDERQPLPTIWDALPSASGIDKSALIGKKPNRTILVHHEHRRQTLTRERDILVAEIKDKTNCTVSPRLEHQGRGKIEAFDVFGSGGGLEKAVRLLNDWISNANVKSIGSSGWAKLSAYDNNEWYDTKVEQLEDERKQQFKGPIPAASGFQPIPMHRATVGWPDDLTQESMAPRNVFGNKLEGLDGLRMQDEVFINADPAYRNEQWHLEICGYDAADVETAKEHLSIIIKKLRADKFGVQNMLNVILDWNEGMDVELQKDEAWWPNHNDRVVPRLLPSPMMNVPGGFRQEGIYRTQLCSVQDSIKAALDNVRHRRGTYDFAVRLGCVALSSKHVSDDKIGQKFNRSTFLKEINSKIELDVKKWLANDEMGYLVLQRLMTATDFLEPTKSAAYYGYTPTSLPNTRPTFRGTWVFQDPNSPVSQPRAPPRHAGRPAPMNVTAVESVTSTPTTLIVVQIDWTDDEEGHYEKDTPRFYKLDPGKKAPKKNMDISLLELGESRAWHFALESLTSVPAKTVSPVLTGFANRVAMKPKYDIGSTETFATWDSTPTIKKNLLNGRLDSIYNFGIQKTCYKVEVTAMWYPAQKLPVWGLAVRHPQWATHLAELERLSIGRQASWGDTLSTFFPDDSQSSSYADDYDGDYGMKKLQIDHDGGPGIEGEPREGIRALTDNLLKLSEIVSLVTEAGGVRI